MIRWAETAKTLVVIWGGILGIEAGNGLRKRGLQVAVVGRNKRLLSRQWMPSALSFSGGASRRWASRSTSA